MKGLPEAFNMRLFTQYLGWTREEVLWNLVDIRKGVMNPKIHAYFPM
jgi:hypothetical protein